MMIQILANTSNKTEYVSWVVDTKDYYKFNNLLEKNRNIDFILNISIIIMISCVILFFLSLLGISDWFTTKIFYKFFYDQNLNYDIK